MEYHNIDNQIKKIKIINQKTTKNSILNMKKLQKTLSYKPKNYKKLYLKYEKTTKNSILNMKKPEQIEQIKLVNWLNTQRVYFTSIPNETFTKSWNQKRKNKQMGLNPGFPDLIICWPMLEATRMVFIEMKAPTSKTKENPLEGWSFNQKTKAGLRKCQKDWIDQINKCEQVQAFVCYSFEEAKNLLEDLNG